jgi:hypothetical protein
VEGFSGGRENCSTDYNSVVPACFVVGRRELVGSMTLHLDIPESITGSLRLPVPEMEPRLRVELAIALYAQICAVAQKASCLSAMHLNLPVRLAMDSQT